MSDTLHDGRRFRTFNILNEGVREVLAVKVDTSLSAERVSRVLKQAVAKRGQLQAVRLDNAEHTPSDCEPRITRNFGKRSQTISIEGT